MREKKLKRKEWFAFRKENLIMLGWDATVSAEEYRKLLVVMYHVENLSLGCIARRLGVTGPTVRNDFERLGLTPRPKGGNNSDTYGRLCKKLLHKVCVACSKAFVTSHDDYVRCPNCWRSTKRRNNKRYLDDKKKIYRHYV